MTILVVASGGAGCGESDDGTAGEGPAATARTGESPKQARGNLTKPPRKEPATDGRRERRPSGNSKAASSPDHPLVVAAIHRYLLALNARDLDTLCARFARLGDTTPPVCQRSGAPARQPVGPTPQQASGIAQIGLRAPPRVAVRKKTAQATVELIVIGRDGTRSVEEETITLRRGEPGWVIAGPSPIFARVFSGGEGPRAPASN